MKTAVIFLNMLLTVCLCLALLPGCIKLKAPASQQGPLGLSEVTTAGSVTTGGQPLSVATTFISSAPVIYVSAKLTNAPEDTSISARCVYVKNDAGTLINQQISEDSLTAGGTRYVSFSSRPPSGTWGSGQYTVSLLVNGTETASTNFTVQPVQKPVAAAPTISYFKASPEAIGTGQTVTLSWNVGGTTQVSISTIGSVAPSGTMTVTPVSSIEYVLTATNNAGTTSMKVNIDVTSFGKDKPELVVTEFHVEGTRAYFKVKNLGGVQSRPSTAYLFVEGSKRASSLVEVLYGDEEREQFFPNFEWTYGSGRTFKLPVRVCADGLDQVAEYDENNNCLVMDW